jgi:hypothetical protein
MIDLVLELDHGICTTVKAVTPGEIVRDGPASAAGYPFSLLLEVMAQAAIPLSGEEGTGDRGERSPGSPSGGSLVGIDEARLVAPVHYGDRLLVTASIVGQFGRMIRVKARAERSDAPPGEGVVAEGMFTIALEGAS